MTVQTLLKLVVYLIFGRGGDRKAVDFLLHLSGTLVHV
jgi:hypothetical protein